MEKSFLQSIFLPSIINGKGNCLRTTVNNNVEDDDEKDEVIKFDKALDSIIEQATSVDIVSPSVVVNSKKEVAFALKWLRNAMKYNLPNGKRNRGLAVVMSHKILSKHLGQLADLQRARIVGWCIEILQTHFLILDDIMDDSLTRRGQTCWHLNKDVGNIAINDSFFMQMSIFHLIDKHFSKNVELHSALTKIFHETMLATVIGQELDLLSSTKPNERPNFALFTQEKYNTIVDYKTAIYSFSTPVRLGLILSGLFDQQLHTEVDAILRRMGQYFQIQDDYLDCFGDPLVMGKIGTDIEEGKCCWLIVNALKLANREQQSILEQNYGIRDQKNVDKVKQVYRELNLEKVYRQYEKDTIDELRSLIESFKLKTSLPGELFYSLLAKICGRDK